MIIDAHQHIWDRDRARYDWLTADMAPINSTITQEDALPLLERHGIDGVVLVQAADNDEDTAFMLDTAARHPSVAGVVAYVPLDDPARTEQRLAELSGNPIVVGIRNLIHDLPDPDFLLRDDVNESLALISSAGLSFDVVSVLPRHLEHVPVLSERHPDLRMVIDHLSKPPVGASDREPWWSLINAAAQNPLVHAKVSGLYGSAEMTDWSTESIRPFVSYALEIFGADRLMYGGDWPISVLAGGYDAVWDGVLPLLDELDTADRDALLGGTAINFYRLDPARLEALR